MLNLSLKKTKMKVQNKNVRISNFDEVALGYTKHQAINEAKRCLNCREKPCVKRCPVSINIPAFIEQVRLNNFKKSYEIIRESSLLPAVCGRVCPQELQCESGCVRGLKGDSVAIGRLERFVSDWHYENFGFKNCCSTEFKKNGKKIAVIGSGPAGISCAGQLAMFGFDVCVFEALHKAGGVLVYGIPEFRLPNEIVEREIRGLKSLGVKIYVDVLVGNTFSLNQLFDEGFDAVFVGVGAGLPRLLKIPGESLNGVYCANEFLTRINLMNAFLPNSQTPIHRAEKFAIIGGGNVAMDAARCARRLGAKQVCVIYRRGIENMPARREEIENANEEGIIFKEFCNPVRFLGDEHGFVKKIVCEKTVLKKVDGFEKESVVSVANSEFEIEADGVVVAVGTLPNPLIKSENFGVDVNSFGGIVVDERTCETSKAFVYAGGDVVSGAATVILAMEAGKRAAKAIFEKFI